MKTFDLKPGMEVAVKDGRHIQRGIILEVGGWKLGTVYSRWVPFSGPRLPDHALAIEGRDLDGLPRWKPAVVRSAQILCTWAEHQAAEARKKEQLRKDIACAERLDSEYAARVDAVRHIFDRLWIRPRFSSRHSAEVTLTIQDAEKIATALEALP